MFNNIYQNKKIFVTGHTGFKGSWLCAWLDMLGARVVGYSLEPPTQPNHFDLLNLKIENITGDIRDFETLARCLNRYRPEMVIHLAAQPLVLPSYTNPVETFDTNVMGTVNVLEACRKTPSVRAILNVTSDKCYENQETLWGYRENEPMGGHDPYSSSKGCAELITASYRKSFFPAETFRKSHHVLLVSLRSGNVVGGGDWAEGRIIPDIAKAVAHNHVVKIRNPQAVRPWQHVLDPLCGYLTLGQKLLEGRKEFSGAWNFGPNESSLLCVRDLVKIIEKCWNRFEFEMGHQKENLHEATFLRLDSSKARFSLKWQPFWDQAAGIQKTMEWYQAFYENQNVVTLEQIKEYMLKENAANPVSAPERL
jgi:CDP-glucose 4,6-dehydratase